MHAYPLDFQHFSRKILDWYQKNPRELPWRGSRDPYRIWLSEIILQQTRIAQGRPYYERFVDQYPNLKDLALAPEEEVLRLWQGLGYYSRARNLHHTARYIWHERGGVFPESYSELLKLKGVGSYTAAAIASMAFGEAKAVLDGNVFRVLARVFGIDTDIASGKGKREFQQLADQLIPAQKPDVYNQAIMDFGSRYCVPHNPDCEQCPLLDSCIAYRQQLVKNLPVKINKTRIKNRYFHYFVLSCGDQIVWKKRTPGDIWEGLFDFPMQEYPEAQSTTRLPIPVEDFEDISVQRIPKKYRHLLSHQRLHAEFFYLEIATSDQAKLADWVRKNGFFLLPKNQINDLPKPKLIVNFLTDHSF